MKSENVPETYLVCAHHILVWEGETRQREKRVIRHPGLR